MSVDLMFDFILESKDGTFQVEFDKLVEHGSNERVKSIVETVLADIPISNIIDIHGSSLLHLAAKHNNIELIEFLIDSGCDINIKNSDEETPLITAYNSNNFAAMIFLLDANADLSTDKTEQILRDLISKKDISLENVITSLIRRFKNSSEEFKPVVALLAKLDCPLKFVINLGDALFTQKLARWRQYDVIFEYDETAAIVKHLMTMGDFEQLRVIWQSRRLTDFRRQFLGNLGLNYDINRKSADWKFIKPAFKQLEKWIVFDKCFVEFIWILFLHADEVVLEVLLQECNVDVQLKEKYQFDVLPLLFGNMKKCNENIGDLALKRAFDVNAKSFGGRTALHCAIFYRQSLDKVQLLLDLGANCSIKDDTGCSPLAMSFDPECIQLMLQSGNHLPVGEHHEFEVLKVLPISGYYSIWKTFLAQLAFEDYQGVKIKLSILKEIDRRSEIEDYYEECSCQLEELMDEEILPSLTMFDTMTSKATKLSGHIQSEEAVSKIAEWCSQHNLDPFYTFCLKTNSEKAFNIFRSKSRAASIIHKNTSVLLSHDDLVVEKICGYLFYRDILKLASA